MTTLMISIVAKWRPGHCGWCYPRLGWGGLFDEARVGAPEGRIGARASGSVCEDGVGEKPARGGLLDRWKRALAVELVDVVFLPLAWIW